MFGAQLSYNCMFFLVSGYRHPRALPVLTHSFPTRPSSDLLVAGGLGFEYVGLSSELGALAFGAMLAKHKRASELSNSLWAIKEVFLVGFFLKIGIRSEEHTSELQSLMRIPFAVFCWKKNNSALETP